MSVQQDKPEIKCIYCNDEATCAVAVLESQSARERAYRELLEILQDSCPHKQKPA
jgi:hypothetical protein